MDTKRDSWKRVVSQMIAVVRIADPERRKLPRPPLAGAALWKTQEYIIYAITRYAWLLRLDGLPESDAVPKIDSALDINLLTNGIGKTELVPYLVRVLENRFPNDPTHPRWLIDELHEFARAEVVCCTPLDPGDWPPREWRYGQMTEEAFGEEFGGGIRGGRLLSPTCMSDEELAEFVVRKREGDEIWHYSSPPDSWQLKMGRGGIVLVRDGRVLADVMTMMN